MRSAEEEAANSSAEFVSNALNRTARILQDVLDELPEGYQRYWVSVDMHCLRILSKELLIYDAKSKAQF